MQYQRTIDWSGGMDELHQPNALAENAAPLLYDVEVDRVGKLASRPGVVSYGGRGQTPQGLALFDPPAGERRLVGFWDGALYHSSINGIWLEAASDCSLVSGLHAGQMGRDAGARWRLYVHSVEESPSDASYWASGLLWVDPNDGSYSQTFVVRPGCAVFWQGRLWASGFCQSDLAPDTVAWSTIWDGGDWSAYLANNLRVDPAAGGKVTALLPARGGEPLLYVFKERAVYLFTVAWNTDGFIPGSANDIDTTTAQIQALSYRVGCLAPLTAIWVPAAEGADVYFLAHDGLRSLRRTQEDVASGGGGLPLTHLLPDLVGRVNWTWAHRAVAATYGNYYYCALPLDGSVTNNHVLVKNLLVGPFEGWTLWRLAPRALLAGSFPAPRLFAQLATATSDTMPGESTATLAAHVFEIDPDAALRTDPGGSEVRIRVQTRSYDGGQPGLRKQWRWAELEFSADGTGSTIWVLARRDDETTWQTLGTFFASTYDNSITLPAPLPWQFNIDKLQTTKFGLETVDPSFNLALRLDGTGRGTLRLRQAEVVFVPLAKEWA